MSSCPAARELLSKSVHRSILTQQGRMEKRARERGREREEQNDEEKKASIRET
jgi:hypothetical protein